VLAIAPHLTPRYWRVRRRDRMNIFVGPSCFMIGEHLGYAPLVRAGEMGAGRQDRPPDMPAGRKGTHR